MSIWTYYYTLYFDIWWIYISVIYYNLILLIRKSTNLPKSTIDGLEADWEFHIHHWRIDVNSFRINSHSLCFHPYPMVHATQKRPKGWLGGYYLQEYLIHTNLPHFIWPMTKVQALCVHEIRRRGMGTPFILVAAKENHAPTYHTSLIKKPCHAKGG